MHSFTMMLHLEDGDNFIPVVIEDNHGNKTEFETILYIDDMEKDIVFPDDNFVTCETW